VLIIEKDAMVRLLHEEPAFSDRFIAYMLARNIRIEADLVDHLFNSSEKRLARTLLLLSRYGEAHPEPDAAEDLTGDAGRDDRRDALAGELLHEQVQEARPDRVQRRTQINSSLLSVVSTTDRSPGTRPLASSKTKFRNGRQRIQRRPSRASSPAAPPQDRDASTRARRRRRRVSGAPEPEREQQHEDLRQRRDRGRDGHGIRALDEAAVRVGRSDGEGRWAAVVGVPASAPAAVRVRPAGSAPAVIRRCTARCRRSR
jgi:hypothetical protein